MATKQQRLVASLKKENRRIDLKRLSKAANYLGLAHTALDGNFNDPEFAADLELKSYIEEMKVRITLDIERLEDQVQEG